MATSLRSRTTVKPPAKDALDVGTVNFGTVLTIVDPGWEVIPPEDIFVKKELKAKVQKSIDKAVKAILAGEESSQEDENSNQEEVNVRNHRGPRFSSDQPALRPSRETDHGTCSRSSNLSLEIQQTDATRPPMRPSSGLVPLHEPDSHFDFDEDDEDDNSTDPGNELPAPARKTQRNQNVSTEPVPRRPEQNPPVERPINPTIRQGCVQNMLFPIETFHLMQEWGWLPDVYDSYRLNYELDRNHLIVHMASPAHDAAANSWNDTVTLWHTNGGNGTRTLRHVGKGRITHLRYMLTFPEYRWFAGSEKSPDQSFVPRAILSPPALIMYPWYHRRSVSEYGDRGLQDP